MALYRLGEAELQANGQVIGKGTNWQDQLALVRVGATIVFLSGSSPVLATISAIKSPTELTVIESDNQTAAMGKYVILLHDSITVEGLAQDVAETLRYYQSQETEIADAVDYFRTFDWAKFEKIASQVKSDSVAAKASATEAKTSEINAKTSETNSAANAKIATDKAAESKLSADSSATSKTAAAQSETNAKNFAASASLSASAAKASEDKVAADASAASKAASAALVSQNAAKTSETNSKTSETNAKASQDKASTSALAAAGSATAAKTSETNAKSSETKSAASATTATQQADRAKAIADSIDPTKLLAKDQNLADVTDKSAARINLGVPGTTDVGLSVAGDIKQSDANNLKYNGFFAAAGADGVNYLDRYSPGMVMRRVNSVFQMQGDVRNGGNIWIRSSLDGGDFSQWKRAMIEGDFGLGGLASGTPRITNVNQIKGNGFYTMYGAGTSTPTVGAPSDSGNEILVAEVITVYSSDWIVMASSGSGKRWTGIYRTATGSIGWTDSNFGWGGDGNMQWNQSGNPASGLYKTDLSNNVWGNTGTNTIHVNQRGTYGFDFCFPVGGDPGIAIRTYNGSGAGNKFTKMMHAETSSNAVTTTNANSISTPGLFSSLVQHTASNSMPTTSTGNYSYMQVIGRNLDGAAYQQFAMPYATKTDAGRMFYRGYNTDGFSPWKEISTVPVSDERLKEVMGNLNVEGALDNINRIEFKIFKYLNDTPDKSARRGVVSQQIRKIDREYVREIGGYYHLDETPMLLDGLAAIKALRARDVENKERISKLESEVSELKEMIAALIAK